ncbi:unnamed protein product [Orchesella dallaii]|uniref:Uncharacterized protein n=1 Tax=Orchesella dallaii TaxID=48710 RepID=A0ABP1QFS1_9HEXA
MNSTTTIALLIVAIVFMQFDFAVSRPTEKQKTEHAVDVAPAKERLTNQTNDSKTGDASESSVVNNLESKHVVTESYLTNSEKPSFRVRERRWDGCGYKGVC